MRIVLDTNVLIAAFIARGTCADLLEHCVLTHVIVVSEFIFQELREHLIKKFGYSLEEADDAIALIGSQAELVVPIALDQPTCRDPDDDRVLGTAIAGQADCIVTGDKDLLVIQKYRGVEIIKPGDFAEFETRRNLP